MGNHINVMNGHWTAQDAGIGAGVDSYFEYLLKGGILFGLPRLVDMFKGNNLVFFHFNFYLQISSQVCQLYRKLQEAFFPV